MNIIERVRAYVSKIPPAISGAGGHNATFKVALALMKGFSLTLKEAFPVMADWNSRCQPPWSDEELRHKLDDAAASSELPDGYLLEGADGKATQAWPSGVPPMPPTLKPARPKWPKPDYELIKRIITPGYTLEALRKSSPVPHKPPLPSKFILLRMFLNDPLVTVGKTVYNFQTLPLSECIETLHDYGLIVPSAATKREGLTTDGKLSQHCLDVTGGRQYLVCETDFKNEGEAGELLKYAKKELGLDPLDVAASIIHYLRGLLPRLALVVYSGGKSLHAYFNVRDMTSSEDLDGKKLEEFMRSAALVGCDPRMWTRSQFARMPGGLRRGDDGTILARQPYELFDPNHCMPYETAPPEYIDDMPNPPCELVVSDKTHAEAVDTQTSEHPPGPQGTNANANGVDLTPLDARRIDLANPPAKPVPVFTLGGQHISTAGNLTVIAAQAKAGKSAIVGAMLASVIAAGSKSERVDSLGFEAHPHNGKAVILFDTEQSKYDSYLLVERAARRAGMKELPPNFRPYRLLDVSTAQRRAYLSAEMERASAECGGVYCLLVDGVGDLCVDLNSMTEAFPLVDELVQLAVKYDCPIVLVLHENPGQQNGGGKTRGHLGSQLERKAESNLRVVKDGEVSIIFSDKCRNACLPKDVGVQFTWSDPVKMHVTCTGTAGDAKLAKRKEKHRQVCEIVFDGVSSPLSWGDLVERMQRLARLTLHTAERRIREWTELGLIKKGSEGGGYEKAS